MFPYFLVTSVNEEHGCAIGSYPVLSVVYSLYLLLAIFSLPPLIGNHILL